MKTSSIVNKIDWQLTIAYLILMFFGWIAVYSAAYNADHPNIFDFKMTYGKQFVWIVVSLIIGFLIINLSSRLFSAFANVYYVITILLLILLLFFGKEVNGNRAWFDLGFFRLQPSEFSKISTALVLSSLLSNVDFNLQKKSNIILSALIIFVPFVLVATHDTGSSLVFLSFILLLYRFGLSAWIVYVSMYLLFLSIISLIFPFYYIVIAISLIIISVVFYLRRRKEIRQILAFSMLFIIISGFYSYSIDFTFDKLKKHQQDRIRVMLGQDRDDEGRLLNVHQVKQSTIAIGAGQFLGKGFLNGTQSKGSFLPAKDTDTIFCTIGEEFGFVGSILVIALYVFIMFRIMFLAEKQKSKFSKVYGYAIVCIFAIHFIINIGMTLRVMPVIGIPLPALSYGGSSLIAFTILIFSFIKMDSEKWIYA
jgi:rod shape determining protein RodA